VLSVVAPGVTHDPFGNAVAAVLEAGTIGTSFIQVDAAGRIILYAGGNQEIIIDPARQALFFYSPSAGAGNLVESISPVGGTDSFGNAYSNGFTSYGGTQTVQHINNRVFWTNAGQFAAALAGLTTIISGVDALQLQSPQISGLYTAAVLNLVGRNTGTGLVQIPAGTAFEADAGATIGAGLTVTGGLTADNATVSSAVNALGALLSVISGQAAPSGVPILFRGQGATDRFIALDIAGETNRRVTITPAGVISWGPGTGGVDTSLSRVGVGLLGANYIAFAASGVAETWNAPTFANGWVNAALGANLQYRKAAAPDNCVQIIGTIVAPAGIVGGQNIITALPASYRPATLQQINCFNTNGPKACNIAMTTAGQLQFQAGAVAGDTIAIPGGNLIALTA
jgi:hypothetical protein